jgi:hypothetical protein
MRPPALPSLAAITLPMLLASASAAFAQASAPYVCMTRDFSKRVGYVSPVFRVAPAEATPSPTACARSSSRTCGTR